METYRDILEHHGIKGMKWGIRKSVRSEQKHRMPFGTMVDGFQPSKKPFGAKVDGPQSNKQKNQEEIERKVARRQKIVKGALITAATYTLGKAAYKRYSYEKYKDWKNNEHLNTLFKMNDKVNIDATRKSYPNITKNMTDSAVKKLSNYSLNDLKDLDLY